MTTKTTKMGRLRLVLVAAAALGSSSAVLSGTLAVLEPGATLPRTAINA
jgi:hypothetical protein